MADDCDMYASLAVFSSLPHMGKDQLCKSSPCALLKVLGAFSFRKFLIFTLKYRVNTLFYVFLESQPWISFARRRFPFCDAKVLLAEKF